MKQNFGVVRVDTGRAVLRGIPVPRLQDDYMIVRPVTIALNPTDWTTLDAPGQPGSIVGCDYAGVVVEVGKGVKRNFKPGDRVAGYAHGGNDANHEHGAFARYITVKGDTQWHIPSGVSFEDASTVGVGLTTLGYGLYKVLGLPWPEVTAPPQHGEVLIYGGSTATGALAIQFAKLSGFKVLATASPKNFERVKTLGADAVFDYRDPSVGKQIREATQNRLSQVFDCVSTEETAAICADAIGSSGGKYCTLLGPKCPRSDVETTFFLGYSVSGEAYIFEGESFEADPDLFEHGVRFVEATEAIWSQGKFVTHPVRLEKGGLRGALEEGLQILREGRYSGEKLVYRVEETDWPTS
ncbi:uncharacterized protein HMPREF1541_05535 [Cyphellophora europaea CBS 101466]|uniref:Enoyl reductase (ER) domain-containing protein n=1 Tax=Cyphellophora europaea (strain CBS 101466) TaxID=1220924 RepID=W2RS81_CYPE1|nr:uncharacterized protein HMPREF1541_05535 [Cyphellophora europaea CBS 101466]ETN39312.1 hypothetical protein HMPREF1541_05535 [Cyphellophora europaea CBS 101466]